MSTPSYQIKNLDHLGLVAGMCRELEIAEMIDAVIPKQQDCHVTHGQAFVAMLLNGLGFHSRTLHMYSDFFATKPTERLIGEGVKPEHLNDDVLGRCLDALFEADVSMLYQVMAERVVDKLGLRADAVHLDITSFHVDGKYEHEGEGRLQLVKGYSRDHRPELNQVILELICENQAGIPVYMQAMDGNFSSLFGSLIRKVGAAHPVFYEDEVDIHLNPKIGADWSLRGKQKQVITPGQNKKYYLAGALHAGTGKVTYVGAYSKNSELFIAMLGSLRRRYRNAKTITLVVDNYIIHKSKKT